MEDLRYPIGRYEKPHPITDELRKAWIQEIRELPERLKDAVEGLTDEQLDTPYRPDGWTVRQLVHHLADTHMNNYIRIKLALTVENPQTILYDIEKWGEFDDAKTAPIQLSLAILEGLHRRWTMLLSNLTPEEFVKTFVHPRLGVQKIEEAIGIYAWHGKHHVAHITSLCKRMNWK
jgi:hypothetical protein